MSPFASAKPKRHLKWYRFSWFRMCFSQSISNWIKCGNTPPRIDIPATSEQFFHSLMQREEIQINYSLLWVDSLLLLLYISWEMHPCTSKLCMPFADKCCGCHFDIRSCTSFCKKKDTRFYFAKNTFPWTNSSIYVFKIIIIRKICTTISVNGLLGNPTDYSLYERLNLFIISMIWETGNALCLKD